MRAVCGHNLGKFEGVLPIFVLLNFGSVHMCQQGMQNATRAGSQLFHQDNISKRRASVIDLSDLKPSFSPLISEATQKYCTPLQVRSLSKHQRNHPSESTAQEEPASWAWAKKPTCTAITAEGPAPSVKPAYHQTGAPVSSISYLPTEQCSRLFRSQQIEHSPPRRG